MECGEKLMQGVPSDNGRPITADQVAWIMAAIERYLPRGRAPSVSRSGDMQVYALLYEIMEVANLSFGDDGARHNATPPDVRIANYRKDGVLREQFLNTINGEAP